MLFVDENLDDAASAMNDYYLCLDMRRMICGSTPFEAYGTKSCQEMTDCVNSYSLSFWYDKSTTTQLRFDEVQRRSRTRDTSSFVPVLQLSPAVNIV